MGWGRRRARGPRWLCSRPPPPQRRGRGGGLDADKGAETRAGNTAGSGGSMSTADPDSDPAREAVASAYQRFEPRAYLRNNYAPPRGNLSSPDGVGPWKLRCLAQTFATGERGGTKAPRTRSYQEANGARARVRWEPRS